ncbi:MAG: GNAT family N-acetyltransferase [Alphaproteobacteria bacterium]
MEPIAFSFRPADSPAALEPVWRDLEARADGGFFLSWDWIGAWLAEIDDEPVLLEGRSEGRAVALGLACRVAGGPRSGGALHLHQTGRPDLDSLYLEYNGFLLDRRFAGAGQGRCAAALLDEGARRGAVAGWDRIVIGAASQSTAEALAALPGILRRTGPALPASAVDLAAIRAAGGDYPGGLSPNTRYQIRRATRLYAARGKLTLEAASDVAAALAWFEGLCGLHQATWTARGRPGAFGPAFFRRFHRRLIETGLPRGAVELLRVAAGDSVVGYLYNFRHRGTVHYYASGFAYEADNKARPGLVCHALAIEHHLAGGAARYDFMAGGGRYKESLGRPAPGIRTVTLQRPGLRARLGNALYGARQRLRG